ncbi:hypothetical protein HMPREF9178_0016 [Streptococcus mitis bv. 2 str. F0392]|uniref:Uncharacterized protein n=1 Tax=Streptococcus mitis bv. 2 str. F0392 TaxID=768726 RepID=F9P188_STROR|nr:hypothetical protein HMPREF9178_0016 [Streptococcus mitis bv. 2 str. F0392]
MRKKLTQGGNQLGSLFLMRTSRRKQKFFEKMTFYLDKG